VREGYRFKGRAVIHQPGSAAFDEGVERMRADGSRLAGRANDDRAVTEAEMLKSQRARFAWLHERHVGR
jgi:hypothetical protein